MAQAEAWMATALTETRSTQADLAMDVPGGLPLSRPQQPQQRPEQVDRASATDRAAGHSVACSTDQLVSFEVASVQTDSLNRRSSAAQTAEVRYLIITPRSSTALAAEAARAAFTPAPNPRPQP